MRVLTECVHRDNDRALVPRDTVFAWGDRIATWYLRELDVRAHVAGKGWAHAVAHGADAIGALAGSPHFVAPELTVLLDVLADRVLLPVDGASARRARRMPGHRRAAAYVLPLVLEPGCGGWPPRPPRRRSCPGRPDPPRGRRPRRTPARPTDDPFPTTGNPEAFLRALHLQLALARAAPAVRPDLLLVLVDALRATNRHYLRPH